MKFKDNLSRSAVILIVILLILKHVSVCLDVVNYCISEEHVPPGETLLITHDVENLGHRINMCTIVSLISSP